MDNGFSYDRYRALLAEKKSLFTDYNETTQGLKQSLEQKNDNQLKSSLENRHRIIERIERINQSIDVVTKEPKNRPVKFNRSEVIRMRNEIELLMENSSKIEKECMNLVLTERNRMKKELLQFSEHRSKTGSYKMNDYTPARFVDTMK